MQVPNLLPGDTIVLDNCSTHNTAEFRAAVRAAGARLLYTPPYSPKYNPVSVVESTPANFKELLSLTTQALSHRFALKRRAKAGVHRVLSAKY